VIYLLNIMLMDFDVNSRTVVVTWSPRSGTRRSHWTRWWPALTSASGQNWHTSRWWSRGDIR